MLTLEKSDLDDTPHVVEATIEALSDLLKAQAPSSPVLGMAPMIWAVEAYTKAHATGAPVLAASTVWCQPTSHVHPALCGCNACAERAGTGGDLVTYVAPTGAYTLGDLANLLDAAADQITRFGWTQGEMHTLTRSCLVGAISTRFSTPLDVCQLPPIFGAALAAIEKLVGDTPMRWNDWPDRRKSEVIDMLRRCAVIQRRDQLVLSIRSAIPPVFV